jgi:alkylation response protein AidB-like acyl-CoA dehydrogenase
MVMDAPAKQDAGRDVGTEASMIKVFVTEMATEIVSSKIQRLLQKARSSIPGSLSVERYSRQ